MANNQTISTVLKTIAAAYPRFEITEDTVKVWASFIADLDDDLLMAAVARFISSSEHAFAPSIPEIRKQATDIRREVACIPTAFEAWEEVSNAPTPGVVPRFTDGKFHDPTEYAWSHELVGLIAKRLGWPRRFPGNNPEADRAHFVKAYDLEISKRLKAETQTPLVTQYIEGERSKLALDVTGEMKRLAKEKSRD